jgi:glycosyltransferase involved in cell wall biosynthesis
MKDEISIIIPCKNENSLLLGTLHLLNNQLDIDGVIIIVADSSTDNTRELIKEIKYKFNLHIVDGGLPSIARNNGAKHAMTPYILFLDADMFLHNKTLIKNALKIAKAKKYELLTCKIRTDDGSYNWVYKIFDKIQFLSKFISPFCLGGFMLTTKKAFERIGGFNENAKIAEDYLYSKEIKKFGIINKKIYTTSRRFKNKGFFYMLKLMVGSFLNRHNMEYFTNDKNYWK